jgi:flavin reductase (DIM6/NTAB) family NADH-FMN oxidoreductase RutF
VTIHAGHPFEGPHGERDDVRRFRGRLGAGVSLWTSGTEPHRAGLTVTSLMVAAGEPARILALLDPEADLTETLTAAETAVVGLLGWSDRALAEMFAGTAPAPGGAFAHGDFEQTQWGPRLTTSATWAGVRLEETRELGWSLLVTTQVEHLEVGEDDDPLGHRRGRWTR